MDFDVAIVGAGSAGISAARALAQRGRKVVVVEASDRIGGRAWTVDLAGMPLDLGCGWLHSADRNPLVEVGRAAGFEIDRSESAWQDQWRGLGFSRQEQDAAWATWQALDSRMQHAPPAGDRAADALAPGGEWNAYCQALSGYMNGAALDRVSIADFLAYDNAATEVNWRVRAGYGTLIAASLPDVRLRLSTPVRRIALDGRGVRLETDRGDIAARAAVVTVSTNVLARGAIDLGSAGAEHLHAASRLPLGLADKVFLELTGEHPFETETHVIGNPRNPDTGSYYIRPFGRPVIEGFFGGTGAVALEGMGVADAFAFAQDELVALLGSDVRRNLRPLLATAWCRTDWIGGSYSHALPAHADARSVLAAPIDDRLFFAGEATHASNFSTAHGAWESGIRAAAEITTRWDR